MARGHEVTLFNRGKVYSEDPIETVEQIHGDRNADLDKLSGRNWDACIDTCGYLPQSVQASAEFLRERVGQYIFISSISAYANFREKNADETAPLAELTGEQRGKFEKIDPQGELTGPVSSASRDVRADRLDSVRNASLSRAAIAGLKNDSPRSTARTASRSSAGDESFLR